MTHGGSSRREEPPLTVDALEGARTAVLEAQTRPDHEVLDGTGREDLSGSRLGGDARADVDGNAADVVSHTHALAGVDSDAHLEPDGPDGIANGEAAPDATRRAVEQRQEAVAGGCDLASAEVRELTPHQRIVSEEQIAPCPVTQTGRLLRRPDD